MAQSKIAGLIVAGIFGLVGVSQGVIEGAFGTFHEHALAQVGPDTFAVAQNRIVEIRSWTNPDRVIQSLSLSAAGSTVVSLAASRDGRLLAAGDTDGHIAVWELPSGRLLFKNDDHAFSVWSVAFSPDGTLLASGGFDGTVRLWDTTSWTAAGIFIEPRLVDAERRDRAHMGWVRCVTFSPDSRTVVTSGCDGFIRVWDADTLRPRRDPIRGGINVYFVVFSPDGRFLGAVNNPGEIHLYRTDTWELAVQLRVGRMSSVYVLAFSPDGHRLITGGFSNRVEVWDLNRRVLVSELSGHTSSIWGLIVFPDGQRVVTTSRDGTVRLWRTGG